jgi:hypothetical protein
MHFSQLVPTRMLLMKTVSRRVSWRPRRLKDGEFENAAGVEAARHRIAKMRLDLIRQRALNVCIRLESLELDALQMCEISTPALVSLGVTHSVSHLVEDWNLED